MSCNEIQKIIDTCKDFSEVCLDSGIHGLPFQHLELCERRAWFHMNKLDYAHLDNRMKLGNVLHETSKVRDKSIEGLMGLAPDRVIWKKNIVVEAKGTDGAQKAVQFQTLFYAMFLTAQTKSLWVARTEILTSKRHRDTQITQDLANEMLSMARQLAKLQQETECPMATWKPICEMCGFRFLCGFG